MRALSASLCYHKHTQYSIFSILSYNVNAHLICDIKFQGRSVYTTAHLNRPETRWYGKSPHRNMQSNMHRIGVHRNMQYESILISQYVCGRQCLQFFCVFFVVFACLQYDRPHDKQIAITNNDQRNALFSKLTLILGHIVVTF